MRNPLGLVWSPAGMEEKDGEVSKFILHDAKINTDSHTVSPLIYTKLQLSIGTNLGATALVDRSC